MPIPAPDVIGIGISLVGAGVLRICKKPWVGWVMILIGLGFIVWSFKDRFIFTEPKEPAKQVSYTEAAKEYPIIQTLKVGYRTDAPEIITMLGNVGKKSLSSNADISLGIFDFEENRIGWMTAQNNAEIKAGYLSVFSFRFPIRKQMFVITAVESKELQEGILLDDKHIAYTWDNWKDQQWGWWYQNLAFVDPKQNEKIIELVGKFNGCVSKHLTDRDYSSCFAGE